MWGIEITEEELGNTPEEVALTLEYIAGQIRQDYYSGVCPSWALTKKEDNNENH